MRDDAAPLDSVTTPTSRWEHVAVPLRGEHQAHNCGLALGVLDKLKASGFNIPEDKVTAGLEGMEVPLRVAVMGCVVNGPGEAREADLGVASGNGKGQIFVKGEVIKTVPEAKIVETLIEEAMRIAEEMGEPVDGETGGATVTVG